MGLKEALLIALHAVRAHWLRSILTMLGLIIGVSAVILLSACGQGVIPEAAILVKVGLWLL